MISDGKTVNTTVSQGNFSSVKIGDIRERERGYMRERERDLNEMRALTSGSDRVLILFLLLAREKKKKRKEKNWEEC